MLLHLSPIAKMASSRTSKGKRFQGRGYPSTVNFLIYFMRHYVTHTYFRSERLSATKLLQLFGERMTGGSIEEAERHVKTMRA